MKKRQRVLAVAAGAALTGSLIAFHGTIVALFVMMLLRFITAQF